MPVAPDSRRSPSGFDDFAPAPLEPTAQMANLDTPEQPMEAPPQRASRLRWHVSERANQGIVLRPSCAQV
jgi:hypothetical protein